MNETPHTVLWIGTANGLEESPMATSPDVDLVWTPVLDDALSLPLPDFHAVVMDAPDETRDGVVRRLLQAGARRVLVTSSPGTYPTPADLGKPDNNGPAASARPPGLAHVIGRGPAMHRTFELVGHAQRTHATVLLTGETGTGKEVLARSIHIGSDRADGPFVGLNCAAFPDSLLESELFGHVRGAFTGADRAKTGLFQEASGGTIFLDEIGETSPILQVKLLRVLQEREIRPVGGNRSRRVDARVLAATHRDLRSEIARGAFREDLFYRLAVFPIDVPPLRSRSEDVLPLARHFLALHGKRENRIGCDLRPEAERLLLSHPWPGNVRELENEMQRALALSESGDLIPAERLSARLHQVLGPIESQGLEGGATLRESLTQAEAWLLRQALDRHDGRRAATARALGITREGLYN
ncbi:MAG: AAA domain-containing protein [bacterium]|nr:AAA domain-containing protein [bacterium]